MTSSCWCGDPATTRRLLQNPPWGIDLVSGRPWTELEFLADPPDAPSVRVCDQHKTWRWNPATEQFIAPAEPQTTRRTTWTVRMRQERLRLRQEVIAALGGGCVTCGAAGAPDELCLQVQPGLWTALGLVSKTERYEWMLRNLPRVTLVCLDHMHQTPLSNPSTLTHRELVLKAYGGVCSCCGSQDSLGVVAGPDTARLVWPGGRNYNSREKMTWLVRHEFPAGWFLRCRKHFSSGA